MRIQIVEDDRALSDGIRLALREDGITFIRSSSVRQAKEDFGANVPDIVILDINLPDGSGYDYLQWVKERSDVLVLILTANDMETDEVMGLTLGADDYMTKPFSLAVLRARIQLFMKRIAALNGAQQDGRLDEQGTRQRQAADNAVYEEGAFRFDFDRLEFFRDERAVSLSVNEQKLLRLLVENAGRVLPRNVLVDRLWSDGGEYVDENALSVTINRLRRKLENKKDGVSYIQTVYGQGYIWKKKKKESENDGQAGRREE